MKDRRFAEARDCLETVVEQNPNDSAAYLNRAIANVFLGNSSVSSSFHDGNCEGRANVTNEAFLLSVQKLEILVHSIE